jgi:type IV pilus assembly protein PilY1
MKHNQNKYINLTAYATGLALILSFALPFSVNAAPLDLATIPLANSPTVPIQSNLLFIFDDSGSMADDSMPDAHSSTTSRLFRNASYNSIYYNPAIRYLPPAHFTAAGLNTTTYPSQTGLTAATGANTDAKPNWKNVEQDAYGVLSTTPDNLTNNAFYFTTLPGEFCTKADLKDCAAQTAPSVARPFPAPVRWCNDAGVAGSASTPAVNACQATNTTGFTNLRTPTPRIATIDIDDASSTPIFGGITVSGQQIMSAATPGDSNTETTIAQAAVVRINNCTYGITGSCTAAGYSATISGTIITIYAPAGSTTTVAPSIQSSSGTLDTTITAFSKNNVPGQTLFTAINNTTANYNYPGSAAKSAARSDCGATCTYAQEMTNYANWYTYYRTRAQMMKTSTSLAFKDIGDDFRVGFMATSTLASRSLNFARFNTAQKSLWYAKLFSTPSDRNTPLRGALSKAGRIYANETVAKRGIFTDPVEYECQQNFALLTTDGVWNINDETSTYAGGPRNVTNTGNVENMDAAPTSLGMREGTPAVPNTLADVAKYYRDTDLRTSALGNCTGALGSGVCATPSTSSSPPNEKQTMVTLTMGLGVNGQLAYTANYANVASDYRDIENGTKDWPNPNPLASTTTAVTAAGPARIDDLWHAAVNGGGTYFSAKNPLDVVSQLQEAIASIKVKTGAGAAAATSTLNPVTGDNFAYVASYTSGHWTGNLQRRTINPDTGEVQKAATHCVEDVLPTDTCASPSSIVANGIGGYDCVTPGVTDPDSCELPSVLDGTDCKKPVNASCTGTLKSKVSAFTSTARNIKMNVAGALQDFRYTNLTPTQKVNFDTAWLASNLTQWPSLTATQQTNATGTNLVNYLRGETGYDLASATVDNRAFRVRQATMGDLIDSKPSFIGKPTFNYGDPGYQAFKAAQAGRAKTVYVGSNDGMLHAFNADTLEERWAYVPTMVIPNMWKLADSNYSAKHSYYVNGDVIISDICIANCTLATATWKTILVAGLNGGGRGYYALDITNPTAPSLLWEFDAKSATTKGDPNLGFSYGNPIVTKRNSDNKWVVLFTSGYNNIPDNDAFYSLASTNFKPNNPALYTTGNGGGYLYVVDAANGDKLAAIPTLNSSSVNVGNATTPSGLAKIKAFADDAEQNNVTIDVYGGDLLGNVWRFNIDTNQAFNFAQLQAGAAQPITTPPELGFTDNKRVIIVGTGKYLEVSDLTNSNQQTLYAIKDDSATVTLVNPRATLVPQTIVPDGADTRKSGTANAVSFVSGRGWYVDFPDARERQNVASRLVLGTLLVPTTVPEASACQPAGYGWFNFLDYRTGLSVVTNPASSVVSQRTTAPSVGFNVVYVDGKPKISNVVADDPNPNLIPDIPFSGSGTGFQLKRSIWREIID